MTQFEEVLDGVRLALTWASPTEIQVLLEDLVEGQIISEAYGKSLIWQQLTEGIAPATCKAGSDLRGSTTHWHLDQGQLSQVKNLGSGKSIGRAVSSVAEHDSMRSRLKIHPLSVHQVDPRLNQELRGGPVMDERFSLFPTPMGCDYQCNLSFDDENTELLRSTELMQKPVSDNERVFKGNLEDEKEWLEQVEEAARRIAVPLWQHWDRGQKMLLPLVPASMTAADCVTSENTARDGEAQCPVLNMEEETELAIACRTLDADNFDYTEVGITDPSFTMCTDGAAKGLCFSTYDSVATTGLNHFNISGAERNASPAQACAATVTNITDRLQGILDACRVADSTAEVDLLCLMEGAQCGKDVGFTEDIAHLFSPCAPTDTQTDAQDDSFYSSVDQSMTLDNVENVCRAEERVDSQWGAKMQDVSQDPFLCLGDLPDDLSEFLNDDYLGEFVDTGALFDDPCLNSEEELITCCDLPPPMELPSFDSLQQIQEDKVTSTTNTRRKRSTASRSQPCTDENTPSRPKRQKRAGRPKTEEPQAELTVTQDTDTELSSPETAAPPSTPPRILHLHPSIQFITIPDNPGYQVVQTLSLSPPVITLPLPNTAAAPTYILVPAASPPFKRQVPPLSPIDGAVAPVQMSSSPLGSLSETASKAMSPTCASPQSPSIEMSACKESPLPQSPTVIDIPQGAKDYIQEAKAHMGQICQDMEAGLSLTSHYVDVPVSQRETRFGKSTNKTLDKELIIMGDTDRKKTLLGRSQIFEGSSGDKPKRYIVLLGNAGMGKTTLIRKLCLDWSRDCIPQFDFVFLLDGKSLSLTEATFSLKTLLLNLSSFAPSCVDPEAVYAQILAAPKRVLIIFDGFGELRDFESLLQTQEKDIIASLQKDSKAQNFTVRHLYSGILQRILLPGCTLLLSTRPKGTATQLLRRTDSILEVCGFTPTDIETYLSQYFTDPDLRASALDCLNKCSYPHLLCWNPGLCRLVCLVLEQCRRAEDLPRTLTGLCHQVLRLIMEMDRKSRHSQAESQSETSMQTEEEAQTEISSSSQAKTQHKNTRRKSRAQVHPGSHTQRARTKKQDKEEDDGDGEGMRSAGEEADRTEEKELLSQLSSLAWESVKANTCTLPTGRTISAKLKAFGHRTGLFFSCHLRVGQVVPSGETEGGGREDSGEMGTGKNGKKGTVTEHADTSDDHILLWANPFLQSYLASVHLSLSRTITDRAFHPTLPFQSGQKGRRRPQREELELTQRFAVGLLFHDRTELQRLHSHTEKTFRDMVAAKQALVTKHLEGLSYSDLSPAQVLEACHYVYEANSTHGDGNTDSGSTQLVAHLAANLPEVLTFCGVPLKPSDVFAVQHVLEKGGTEGRRFCLDLEDSGIQISGLRALIGLNNINTYRACIADVITLWEQLEQSGEEGLLQGTVSKFKIHPLKATQVCHIEHLAKLVNIHVHKRLSDSSSQSDSILAEGIPAVKELHKLEFELGPVKGPLALLKLWGLLPGLQNLQHLDLENSKIGDKGAEKLADALVSLSSLEILNVSQNCIGDQGMKRLATTLRDLPKLHCLSLYSNMISDEGAESLAAVLPHMASLTDLDVKYNKLTDVGAQSLAASLRNCKKMKTLRMWNQCIPYGVFERLQHQDSRIQSWQ